MRDLSDFDPIVLEAYKRLARKHASTYERLVRSTAAGLGIPGDVFGLDEAKGRAFNPESVQVGSVDQHGIELDAGILMPTRLLASSPTWSKAALTDRVAAALIHEYVEHLVAKAMRTNWDPAIAHKVALEVGPKEAGVRGASETACRILKEILDHERGR